MQITRTHSLHGGSPPPSPPNTPSKSKNHSNSNGGSSHRERSRNKLLNKLSSTKKVEPLKIPMPLLPTSKANGAEPDAQIGSDAAALFASGVEDGDGDDSFVFVSDERAKADALYERIFGPNGLLLRVDDLDEIPDEEDGAAENTPPSDSDSGSDTETEEKVKKKEKGKANANAKTKAGSPRTLQRCESSRDLIGVASKAVVNNEVATATSPTSKSKPLPSPGPSSVKKPRLSRENLAASLDTSKKEWIIWDSPSDAVITWRIELYLHIRNTSGLDTKTTPTPSIHSISLGCTTLSPPPLPAYRLCHGSYYEVRYGGKKFIPPHKNETGEHRHSSTTSPPSKHGAPGRPTEIQASMDWTPVLGFVGACVDDDGIENKGVVRIVGWKTAFWIPVPIGLFDRAETRVFGIDAKVWVFRREGEKDPTPLVCTCSIPASHLKRNKYMI